MRSRADHGRVGGRATAGSIVRPSLGVDSCPAQWPFLSSLPVSHHFRRVFEDCCLIVCWIELAVPAMVAGEPFGHVLTAKRDDGSRPERSAEPDRLVGRARYVLGPDGV